MTTTTHASPKPLTGMTTQQRWNAAARAVRKRGVKWHANVPGCCRSCISADPLKKLGVALDDEETPYAWTYGGQGLRVSWDWRGSPYRPGSWRGSPEAAYVNHGNGAAPIVTEEFRRYGFVVEWDGTDLQCVIIRFPGRPEGD